MNTLLLPELLLSELKSEKKDLLQTLVLLEEYIFQEQYNENDFNTQQSLDTLEAIVEQCLTVVIEIESPLEKAEALLNELFYQHLFIDTHHKNWPLSAFKVATGLNLRQMSPMIKAGVVSEILNACGFSTDLVFVPNKVMVRLCCNDDYAIVFDAVTGQSLDWHELDSCLEELDGDPSEHVISMMNHSAILIEHLTMLKNVLIREQVFDKALLCVDVLLSLNPDDPLQRRDRGFLLHQLDCFKVAVDDYRYFVEQCPKDPAAQLLKIQLDNITISDPTFH